MSIRSRQWNNGSRYPGLMNHIFSYIMGTLRCVCALHLLGEEMTPRCSIGRRQTNGGSLMIWVMVCLGPGIHVAVILSCTTYLIVADQVHPFIALVFCFCWIVHPVRLQKLFRNVLRSMKRSSYLLDLQIPWISI